MKYKYWEAFELHDIVMNCYKCRGKDHKHKHCELCKQDFQDKIIKDLGIEEHMDEMTQQELVNAMDEYC